MTGLDRKDLLGRRVTDLVDEGKFDVVLNPVIVNNGKPKTVIQTTKVGNKVVLYISLGRSFYYLLHHTVKPRGVSPAKPGIYQLDH